MLKLKRFTSGQWFDYPKAEGVKFKIRPLHLSMGLTLRSKIRDKIATEVPDLKSKRSTTVLMEDIDSGKFTWEVFNYILEDFEGISIEDNDGNPIGSTKEELKQAIFDDPGCQKFISEKSEWLRGESEEKLGKEVKNS
jgi:hypothetical protein